MPFLPLNNLNDINYGHVRKCVMRSIIFWTIYLLDLARNYIDKLSVFQYTEASFLDLNLSITNGTVSSKIYDKWDDFNFEIVNFLFLDGDVPHSPSSGVCISQLIRFARVCSNVDDFTTETYF